jgi:hypothetical protein
VHDERCPECFSSKSLSAIVMSTVVLWANSPWLTREDDPNAA